MSDKRIEIETLQKVFQNVSLELSPIFIGDFSFMENRPPL